MRALRKKWFILLLVLFLVGSGLFAYTHLVEGRSLRSWLIEKVSWIGGVKQDQKNQEEAAIKAQEAGPGKDGFIPSPQGFIQAEVSETEIDGMQVFSWNDKKDRKQRVILYLHGGAYVKQPSNHHFETAAAIADKLDARVIFPIYPKAPKHSYQETYQKLDLLYRQLLDNVASSQQISFIGDSAGGGLALGFAMYARDQKLDQPKDIILLSPWLDVKTDNPDIADYEKLDPMLSAKGLRRRGLEWAGSQADLTNPYVSPAFGQLEGLGKISLFVGTHEIFYPDIRDLHQRLEKENIPHNYTVADKMNHIYVIYPIPEAEEAQQEIVDIIRDKD